MYMHHICTISYQYTMYIIYSSRSLYRVDFQLQSCFMWRPISFTALPNMVLCQCVPVSFTGFLCGRSEKMLPGYPAKNIERTNPQRRLKLHSLDALIIVNNVFLQEATLVLTKSRAFRDCSLDCALNSIRQLN